MEHLHYSDALLADILGTLKRVALLGASGNPDRPSYEVMKFLLDKGIDVVPVSPRLAGEEILARKAYASLGEVPGRVDMVDVFRSSDALGEVADDVLALEERPATVWMQLGVWDPRAAARLEAAGIRVVANRCPKIEWKRLRLVAMLVAGGGIEPAPIPCVRRRPSPSRGS